MPSFKVGIMKDRKLSAPLGIKKYKRTTYIAFMECSSMSVKLIQENREKRRLCRTTFLSTWM